MIKPKGNMILVEQVPVEMKSAGGIITGLADDEKRQQMGQRFGIVRDMGADAYAKESDFKGAEPYCKIGDVVMFTRYGGIQFKRSEIMNENPKDGEVHWHIMADTEVVAVLDDEMSNKYKEQRGIKE